MKNYLIQLQVFLLLFLCILFCLSLSVEQNRCYSALWLVFFRKVPRKKLGPSFFLYSLIPDFII